MDRGEMTTPVEPGQHDGIETIGLSSIAGFTRNERWGDDIAVEAVFRENAMKNESSAGGFVASPHRTFLR